MIRQLLLNARALPAAISGMTTRTGTNFYGEHKMKFKQHLQIKLVGDYLKVFRMVAKRMRPKSSLMAIFWQIIEETKEWVEIQEAKKK